MSMPESNKQKRSAAGYLAAAEGKMHRPKLPQRTMDGRAGDGTTAPADRLPVSVIFDLHDTADVTAAARQLAARAERESTGGELLVQRYVDRARELAVRVADDATFGPTITFGCGGTTPNHTDRAVDLPPLKASLLSTK